MTSFSKWFGNFGVSLARHRPATSVGLLIALAIAIWLGSSVKFDSSLDAYFDESDTSYEAYLEYQANFGSDEVAYILYHVPGRENGAFDLETMRLIEKLTDTLEREVPFAREATSLTHVEFIEADDDLIQIHELRLDMPTTQEEMLVRRDAMMKKPLYVGSIVDTSAQYGAIILEMERTSTDPLEKIRFDSEGGDGMDNLYPQVSQDKIAEILARPEYAGITFYQTGDVPMNANYNRILADDLAMLTLLSLACVAVLATVCFQFRWIGMTAPLLVVVLAIVFTIGFMGVAGYSMGLMFLIVPTLLIAIGVAQSTHLISEFYVLRAAGTPRTAAIRKTLENVGPPCLLAALTTAAGFSAMSGSKLEGLAELSVYSAVGIFWTFLLSVIIIVLFMSFGREESTARTGQSTGPSLLERSLVGLAGLVQRYRAVILAISAVIIGLAFVGMIKLVVAFNFIEEFKDTVPFKADTLQVEKIMGGVLSVVYVFDAGEADGAKKAEVLKKIDAVQQVANTIPLVRKTYAVTDILKDINQSFHGDDPAYNVLPDDDALIAQYLLLYEISGGEELEDYMTGDYSKTALELRVTMADSRKIADMLKTIQGEIDSQGFGDVTVKTTGVGLLWVKIADYIAESQIRGYLFAFSAIALVLVVAYRSVYTALLAMIPNLFPIVVVLGVMGWMGAHLDYFKLLLATIAIGIAVDDTVHLLTRLKREFERVGNYYEALRVSLAHVGRALIITTLVLCLSFLVFLTSQLAIIASFGILLAATIALALLADLFLLPALVLVLKPFGPERTMPANEGSQVGEVAA